MTTEHARSILIVEDEAILAEDLRESLTGLGYDAFAIATSADEAIDRTRERSPDIVLMDIRIRGPHDGIDTAALLRARHDVPIVYLTAHADDATLARAKTTAPYGYLVKPITIAALRSAIEITLHRHDQERSRRRAERQLEVADRLSSLATFTAGLAHEINNLLAVVLVNSDYLRDELTALAGELRGGTTFFELTSRFDELPQVQTDVSNAGARIASIIAALSDFAVLRRPALDAVQLSEAIGAAVQATAHDIPQRIELNCDVPALPPVLGDLRRLTTVFTELLTNAVEAIARDPRIVPAHEIAVRARADGPRVVVEIRDDGPGIQPSDLRRVFEPFFTARPFGESRGLGLAVCHGIVTSLGGELEVDSQPGRGSTFRVVLRAVG